MDKKKIKVLVLNDEEITRLMLNNLLLNEGYEVNLADNAKDALKAIEKNNFDLVITDIVMRGMDGVELIQAAKKIAPKTEFVVLTAYPTP
jgi:YesN/AraC family two-component response regulator